MDNTIVCSLSDDTREQLTSALCSIQIEGHRDIEGYDMYEGYSWKGYNNMTDIELVQEYAHCVWEWTDLMKKCLSELGADALLKNIPVPVIDTSELVEENEEKDVQLMAMMQLQTQFKVGTIEFNDIKEAIAARHAVIFKEKEATNV